MSAATPLPQRLPPTAPLALDSALSYARLGWPVLPIQPGTKNPVGKFGVRHASTLEATVRDWFSTYRLANVAVACGAVGGFWVLDVDPRNGGDVQLDALQGKHGALPSTLIQRTGGGGWHYFFRHDPRVARGTIAPGIDCKHEGGYVLVEPSKTTGGYLFEDWDALSGEAPEIAEAPEWLIELASAGEKPAVVSPPGDESTPLWPAAELARIRSALAFAGRADDYDAWLRVGMALHEGGRGSEQALGVWHEWSQRSGKYDAAALDSKWAGFGKRGEDGRVTLASLLHVARGNGWREATRDEGNRPPTAAKLVIVKASAVAPKPVAWLWPGRIAKGKLTIIAGDPGLGKSTLHATLTAHVTTGRPWPVDKAPCPQGDVLLFSAEDDAADTIRPRLDAAGADPGRVHIVQGVAEVLPDGRREQRLLSLRRHVEAIRQALAQIGSVALVVVDPISAYLDGADSHNNAEVRGLLAPLSELAGSHGAALVCITHLNKGTGGSALYRTTGSLAFVAAARAAYLVTRDKSDSERRLFLPLKNNLGPDATGLAYRVADVGGVPCVEWEDEAVTTTADEALGAPEENGEQTEVERAMEWLREVLTTGPTRADEILKAGRGNFSDRTLRRARTELGAAAKREGGIGAKGYWVWSLPAEAAPQGTLYEVGC